MPKHHQFVAPTIFRSYLFTKPFIIASIFFLTSLGIGVIGFIVVWVVGSSESATHRSLLPVPFVELADGIQVGQRFGGRHFREDVTSQNLVVLLSLVLAVRFIILITFLICEKIEN